MAKYLDLEGLQSFKEKQDEAVAETYATKASVPTKVSSLTNDSGYQTSAQVSSTVSTALQSYSKTDHTHATATASAAGLMSAADKSKLDSVSNNANAYTHPTTSGNKHIPRGGSSGQILRWSADGTAVWGADSNTTYSAATTSADGLMTSAMVTKLNGIAAGANAYTHPSYTAKSSGLYKVTVDSTGHVSAATVVAKSDITALGIPGADTTYSAATSSAAGLMSTSDKTKLDGISSISSSEIDALFA